MGINMDPDTDYYASNGVTKLTPGKCYPPGKCAAWGASCSHCRNNVFSSTSLKLPSSMPAGQTVLRWFWYGAMTTAGLSRILLCNVLVRISQLFFAPVRRPSITLGET